MVAVVGRFVEVDLDTVGLGSLDMAVLERDFDFAKQRYSCS